MIKGLHSSRPLDAAALLAAGLLCEHCQLKVKSEWKNSSSSSSDYASINAKESDDSTVLCTPMKASTPMRELVKLDWLIYMRFCVCRIALFDTDDGSNNNNNYQGNNRNSNTASSHMAIFNAIEDYRIDSMTSSRDKLNRLHSFLEIVLKSYNSNTTSTTAIAKTLPPPPSVITKGCEMLLMYINNIIKYPSVPRYRRISTNNQSFCSALQPLNGHHEVLSSVGFVKKGAHYEWEWGLAASKYPNLSSPLKASSSSTSSSSSSSSSMKGSQSGDSHKNTTHDKASSSSSSSSSSSDDMCILPPRDEATIHAVMTESVELIAALKDKPEKCLQLLFDKTIVDFEMDHLPPRSDDHSSSSSSSSSSNRSAPIAVSTGTTNGTLPDASTSSLPSSTSSLPPSSSTSSSSSSSDISTTTITEKVGDVPGSSSEIASWNFAEVLKIYNDC